MKWKSIAQKYHKHTHPRTKTYMNFFLCTRCLHLFWAMFVIIKDWVHRGADAEMVVYMFLNWFLTKNETFGKVGLLHRNMKGNAENSLPVLLARKRDVQWEIPSMSDHQISLLETEKQDSFISFQPPPPTLRRKLLSLNSTFITFESVIILLPRY